MITIQQLAYRIAGRENAKPRQDRDFTGPLDVRAPLPEKICDEFRGEFPQATYADEVAFVSFFNTYIEA